MIKQIFFIVAIIIFTSGDIFISKLKAQSNNDLTTRIKPDTGYAINSLQTDTNESSSIENDKMMRKSGALFVILGDGGESNAFSISFGGLWMLHPLIFGGGLAFIFDGLKKWENNPDYEWGAETELFFYGGLNYNTIILLGSAGISEQDLNCNCGNTIDNKFYLDYSAQLGIPLSNSLLLLTGYHNRKGFLFGLGGIF